MQLDLNVDAFAKQVEQIQTRLFDLYQNAAPIPHPPSSVQVSIAFKELGYLSEKLQMAVEVMFVQTEELTVTRLQVEAERQRYQELFDFAPDAYLVTDLQGKICEANRAAATLLNISPRFLIGKPLAVFIAEEDRVRFRLELNRCDRQDRVQELEVQIQPRGGAPLEAALRVVAVRGSQSQPMTLRWLVRDISEQKETVRAIENDDFDLKRDRIPQFYTKGEVIPLSFQTVWLVSRGLVKLTTLGEHGQEVLVGLAGPEMVFGSCLTSLQTYQATPLSKEVELTSISLAEIAASPKLSQILFSKINHRLKQAECLLAITGQRRVKDRLHYLLMLLKREIGEPVAEGTRLSVRLTHEDFAHACCTTRVTITRLLSKLQQQRQIVLDSKSHIILRNTAF